MALLVPWAVVWGVDTALQGVWHALSVEFFPFIILIATLFVVAGGICVRGNLHSSPRLNTGLLALGTVLASVMGTTGASMLMIRPLIRANDNRKHVVHVMVFFIFLVGNSGGALTPLGDPPLFLGFIKGVDFFWTTKHLFLETLFLCGALLIIFYFLDHHYYHNREEDLPAPRDPTPDSGGIWLEGKFNFFLLAAVIGLVLMSGLWKSHIAFSIGKTTLPLESLLRDVLLLVVMAISWWITPQRVRQGDDFSWGLIQEVGQIFAGIFITIIPVIAMLRAGEQGAFAAVVHAVTDSAGQTDPGRYFGITGILSSFLDNAPNLMIKAIAEERGIKMPSFFGYMMWSGAVPMPLFIVMHVIFFR